MGDLESGKIGDKQIWLHRRNKICTFMGKIFVERLAYTPFILMVCLFKFLHKPDVSFLEFTVAALFSCLLSNAIQSWENRRVESEK